MSDDLFSAARALFRTVGPSWNPGEHGAVKNCTICNPPIGYRCPKCDWETLAKWRMAVHFKLDPAHCRLRAEQKAKAWANS